MTQSRGSWRQKTNELSQRNRSKGIVSDKLTPVQEGLRTGYGTGS